MGRTRPSLAENVLRKVEDLRPRLLPAEVRVDVTRNYGETAQEKSNELVDHLLVATLSVVALISLAMGWRSGLVVGIAVPVTLALTLFIYYVAGYTLNRVTLFALIFSIGILVDDAIVVVENIERHHREKKGRSFLRVAVEATDEVGNPTILATFTVIAAILPMAFVQRDVGPVHEPHPERGVRGHDLLPGRGLHGHPVGGGARLPPPRGDGPRRGARGLVDARLPPGDDVARHEGVLALGLLRLRRRPPCSARSPSSACGSSSSRCCPSTTRASSR